MDEYVYRASELGRCVRASVAARLGYEPIPPPEYLQEIFDKGVEHEELCIQKMREQGLVVTSEQELVVLETVHGRIEGHLDGMVSGWIGPDEKVLEVKSPNAYEKLRQAVLLDDWSNWLAHRYGVQISCYMLAKNAEAFIFCLPEDGKALYFGIEIPPFDLDYIDSLIEKVERHAATGFLEVPCSSIDSGCPFAYLSCTHTNLVEDEALVQIVKDYQTFAEREKQAKIGKDATRDKIMQYMDESGFKSIETFTHRVTAYDVDGSSKISEDLLKADGINPDKYKVKGKGSKRLKVTER